MTLLEVDFALWDCFYFLLASFSHFSGCIVLLYSFKIEEKPVRLEGKKLQR
jgi:hypothetical protein